MVDCESLSRIDVTDKDGFDMNGRKNRFGKARMFIKQTRLVSGVIGLIACFVAGCETIDRARTAQASAASVVLRILSQSWLPDQLSEGQHLLYLPTFFTKI